MGRRTEEMRLSLRPVQGGSYTQFSLSGILCSAPQPGVMHRLAETFSLWSGWPLHVALHVDMRTAGWCEVWTDALADVPADFLAVTFRVAGRAEARR
jgi:hypothetical protein